MQGMRETQLTADIELLPSADVSKQKQVARPPISMNFEVSSILVMAYDSVLFCIIFGQLLVKDH